LRANRGEGAVLTDVSLDAVQNKLGEYLDQMKAASPCWELPLGFEEVLRARLLAGVQSYGDASFELPMQMILGEIRQEAIDLPGWAFIAWSKLRGLKSDEADMVRNALMSFAVQGADLWLRIGRLQNLINVWESASQRPPVPAERNPRKQKA